MRISGIRLASGLMVALVGATAKDASANDVTVSTATTTPLVTSQPDGASPGDVTITSSGSITVGANQAAVTVDSDNDVTNEGTIASSEADNSSGIVLEPGNTGTVTNTGSITLTDNYTISDTDSDGDLDGEFATGTNRNGIHLLSGGTFIGNINNSGSIIVEGENSAGIRLDGVLDGDLFSTGGITVVGDNSAAVLVQGGAAGGVTGDVIIRGNGTVTGENAAGVVIDAAVDGEVRINGTWNVTGYSTINRPADISGFEPEDTRQGGSVVAIHYSVAGGVTIEGIGVEDDPDDDGDGVTEADGDTDDDAGASLTVFGGAPALLIQADPSANLVLGPTASGYGVHVRGVIAAVGVYDGVDATAIRIEGSGGATVTTANGVAIDNAVSVAAIEANAYGLYIGQDATVPNVVVRRQIIVALGADTAVHDGYAIFIGGGATVPNVENTGLLQTQFFGEAGNATVIYDGSDTLATITNSGVILAQIVPTDDDPTDNIPPPPVTGSAIAIDVSSSTIDVTFNQVAPTVFTDDDAVDDVVITADPMTQGEIRFGSGNDTINLNAGTIRGDVSFGAGADVFNIDNGGIYVGQLSDSDGALTINVTNGTLALSGGTVNITSATFDADAQLGVLLSSTPANSTFIEALGTVTFAPGAVIIPVVPSDLPDALSHIFLTANGGLVGAGNVTGVVAGEGVPWVYNLAINQLGNSLEADFVLKTAAELNLTGNQTAAYSAIIDAMRTDAAAAVAFASLDTEYEFFNAYEDLMPAYSSAATELLATAIQQAQGATSNRLSHTRLTGLNEVSVWAQEIAYGLNREPSDRNGLEFRGQGFGLAIGIDGPLDNGALFGLSASFVASETEEPGRPEGEISAWIAQGNAYYGTAVGAIDLDFIAGVGFGQLSSRRFVEIGTGFSALSEADWWAYEAHGTVRASMPMALSDWFVVTPIASLTYAGMGEQGYTESGGGTAIDFEAGDAFSHRLWADIGVEFSTRWRLRGGGYVAPRIYGGYRANALDEPTERTFRFVSGVSEFTLADEPLGNGGPLVGLGIDATNGYSTFSLSYEGEFGDQIERHSLNAAIRFRF